jgi:Zn-finger nucleic acid-binding protein
MNFLSEMEGQKIHVDLKYCERCGGLWLRLQGINEVYCSSCQAILAAMPNPEEAPPRKARYRKARVPGTSDHEEVKKKSLNYSTRIRYIEGVAGLEVCL